MDKNGVLNIESKKRADLAISLYRKDNVEKIFTIGWDYRQDSNLPIALAVKNYLITRGINENIIMSDYNSRDTVGDAIFTRVNFLKKFKIDKLLVVTSDYHVERTSLIFNKILPSNIDFEVKGCKTNLLDNNIKSHEKNSIEAFYSTFYGIDFTESEELISILLQHHPFYNGDIHKKLKFDPNIY